MTITITRQRAGRRSKTKHVTPERQFALVRRALDAAVNNRNTERDERSLAFIEATLRDALGHDHGVWQWRCNRPKHEPDENRIMP
jgi:hypothetical protein